MSYHGDIRVGKIIYFHFTTRQFSTGAPITSASLAISVYKDDSTTESTAGVTTTFTSGFDSRAGLVSVKVDTSADGTFYAAGHDFSLVVTGGTADSVSIVGEAVRSFSIENRSALMPATAGRTLVVDASGLADANTVKVGPTGSGTAQTAGDIPARLPAALGANGNIKADVRDYNGTAGTFAAGIPSVNAAQISGDSVAADNLESAWDGTGGVTMTASILGNLSGSVAAVGGDVGGNIGGDVLGGVVGSVQGTLYDLTQNFYPEVAGAPPASNSIERKIGFIYEVLRNKLTVTSTKIEFFDDAGVAQWHKSLTDDGTTYTESEGTT